MHRRVRRDAEFAAAQRWRFRHLFVDEFQDASAAQFALVQAWLGQRSDLCVVGDPNQAIYGFAGAESAHLEGFLTHFPVARHADVGLVTLTTNYRSSPQVITAAAALLGPTNARPHARAADGPVPTIDGYDTDDDEARAVAAALRRAHGPGQPWSSMAVLYRTNAQSALFEEALGRDAVPFRVRGGGRFLDRPEVKVALDSLRDAARAAPGRRFEEHLTDLVTAATESGEEREEHTEALARLGREYLDADGGVGSVDGFLAFLRAALRGGDDVDDAADAVELLTFHRAKGLEFDIVFVAGLERGLVPIAHVRTSEAIDEERRLLYVALSRSRHTLHLSWARQRARGTRHAERQASPWLDTIAGALDAEHAPEPRAAPSRVTDARRALAAAASHGRGSRGRRSAKTQPTDVDEELLAALVTWRRNLARGAGVPAYVIFHDRTLEAVAACRPRTRDELLAVEGIGPVKVERYGDAVLEIVGTSRDSAGTGRAHPAV